MAHLAFAIVMTVMTVMIGASAQATTLEGLEPGHRMLTGTVTDIRGGMVFIETAEGTSRKFGTQDVAQERLQGVRVGDRITLEVDENNLLVDLGLISDPELPQEETVSGKLVEFDEMNKTVTLSTESGQRMSFRMKDAATAKIANKQPGDRVTLRIDQQNHLAMDVVN